MPTPSPSTVLLDLRRLQRQSAESGTSHALAALLAVAPPEVASTGCVAYLCADKRWAASDAAPLLLTWLAGRRRRLCTEPLLEDRLLPLILEEEGYPRRCVPCLERGLWLWEDDRASAKPPGLAEEDRAATGEGSPRERLAWFSPLPPVRSGISDYSAALIPELARHFEIDVVADPATTPLPEGANAVISIQDFGSHRDDYHHLLFQVGNSTFHLEHLAQLRWASGAIVLHDSFLAHGLCTREAENVLGAGSLEWMYRSHGYQASWLFEHDQRSGEERAIWEYPCNLEPLHWSSGVIVHNREALRLAERFYGPAAAVDWCVVPHLKRLLPIPDSARGRARSELGLSDSAFVICSFGFLGVAKLSDRLLQGLLSSSLATDPEVVFVFAGSDAGNRSLRMQLDFAVSEASRRGGLRAQVRFTGWIDSVTYRRYLEAADGAVQLRMHSRGESSGTVLDAMAAGVPLIVNAHGSMNELPEQTVLRLPDHCSIAQISRALERLRSDDELRARLRQASLAHVAEQHDPAQCASRYVEAIRSAGEARSWHLRWVDAAARAVGEGLDPVEAANALAVVKSPWPRQRQLFLDVSVVARHDLGSGVERVVRAISEALLLHPPQGCRVEPVRAADDGQGYVYARPFALKLLRLPAQDWPEAPIDPRPGDVFLVLDLDQPGVVRQRGFYQLLRAQGVAVHFVVHDLLPCRQPEYFPPGAGDWHKAWLEVVCQCDGALCVSRSVAADLEQWLHQQSSALDTSQFAIRWFHHGSDFCPRSVALSPAQARSLKLIPQGPTLLMVGTVEPRKGYLDVIEAATQLWQQGHQFNLIIVGKEGWKDLPQDQRRTIPETVARLREHPLRQRCLFWYERASDVLLQALYQRADGLIAASYGEGFGIPLIEAASAGVPLLLRDLPVFHEVSQGRASFFPQQADPAQLATAMAAFLDRLQNGDPDTGMMQTIPCQSWRQSAAQIVQALGLRWQEAPVEIPALLPTDPPHQTELSEPSDPPLRVPLMVRFVRACRWRLRLLRIRVRRRLGRVRRLRQVLRQVRRHLPSRRLRPVRVADRTQLHPLALEAARPWLLELERCLQDPRKV